MNDDMLNDLLDQDEDEDDLDDMMAEYEQEAALDVEAQFNQADQQSNTLPSQQQQNVQPQQQVKKADDFDNLMAEMMG